MRTIIVGVPKSLWEKVRRIAQQENRTVDEATSSLVEKAAEFELQRRGMRR